MLYFLKSLFGSRKTDSTKVQNYDQGISDCDQFAIPSALELADANMHFEEGNRQLAEGQLAAAEHHFRSAIAMHPGFAEAQCNLGSLLKDRGDLPAAEHHLKISLHVNPQLAPALFNLAMLYVDVRRWGDAADLLRRTLAQNKWQADAQYWLGNAESGLGNGVAAQKAYGAAVQINPQYVQARWAWVMATIPAVPETTDEQTLAPQQFQTELGKLKRWFEVNKAAKGYQAVGATQPFFLAYIEQNHRVALSDYGSLCASLMGKWSSQNGVPPPVKNSEKRLRIGIVSAHIHSHSVWHPLVKGWVAHLDPKLFELHLFHTGSTFDSETKWASRHAATYHHSRGAWTDWAKLISDSKVDALIYPEIGMDSTTVRLSSLRLARVQLASWGHPITTGLPTMDYFITSQAMEPVGCQEHYSEKLLQLPRLGSCYQPLGTKPERPDVAQWGIRAEDRILLCAGTPFKYRPEHDSVWVAIAQQCHPCKLIFFKDTQGELSGHFEQRLRKAFVNASVDFGDSVRFIPWQTPAVFFGLLDLATVYLDSLGFSGFNTAMKAIERNTPVVAYEGQFMRGRFASAILQRLGLIEMVATSLDQFIQITVRIVQDESHRRSIKRRIKTNKELLYSDIETIHQLGRHLVQVCS